MQNTGRYQGLRESARDLLGMELSPEQLEAFEWYAAELGDWNQRFNLTAITEPLDIEVKHFLDSLTAMLGMQNDPDGRLVDVGTGAGFPGLPLRIVNPNLKVTLVESTSKKVEFCRHIIEGLELRDVQVRDIRVERLAHEEGQRESYRWGVARAVASLDVLVEYVLPLLELGGRMIAMKGETGPAEAQAADPAVQLLGGRTERLIPVELPTVAETRYLVLIDKVSRTPESYPRRVGVPAKRPLGEGD
ncbi:MAG: 16S rRNA (guanine(527)-N(7))-methyltransferase RsmG [Anaerolineales bacterium]|nr:16S rRNA (guanine(527)-N(7))-methyltransferase RsmG [Anaerolineales bacterium]